MKNCLLQIDLTSINEHFVILKFLNNYDPNFNLIICFLPNKDQTTGSVKTLTLTAYKNNCYSLLFKSFFLHSTPSQL